MNTLQAGNEGAGDVEGVEESFQKKLVGVGWSRRRLDNVADGDRLLKSTVGLKRTEALQLRYEDYVKRSIQT